ncbi:unnamed protein product [Paramecium sonneborni]|uniref:RBR-type E3 ubiquitin transferase n=1 Tax=Paramecium sonneborni TaxID=65129 RepID=A0A8S1PGR7_9CILI|nr:unnamed protein product [Paramecium sonneborni]
MKIMNPSLQQINHQLINFINSPEKIVQHTKQLQEILETLCQKKEDIQLYFDGSTFCCHCQEYLAINNFKILPCGHNVHQDCFKKYLIEEPFYLESISTFSCCKESEMCSKVKITDELSESILGKEEFDELKKLYGLDQEIQDDDTLQENEQDQMRQIKNFQDQINNDAQIAEQIQEEEYKQSQERENAIQFDCGICADTYKVNAEAITLECDHRFCKNCLHEYIINLTKEGKYGEDDIKCSSCNTPIDYYIINYCAPECSSKINDERVKKLNSNTEKEKLVNCPGVNCPQKFYVDKNMPFPVCPTCKTAFCINGCGEAHEGKSCEQVEQEKLKARVKEEKGLVSCPKCKIQILKDGGCNHITCQCKHEFCYVCQKSYKPKRECTCPQMTTMERLYDRIIGFFNKK